MKNRHLRSLLTALLISSILTGLAALFAFAIHDPEVGSTGIVLKTQKDFFVIWQMLFIVLLLAVMAFSPLAFEKSIRKKNRLSRTEVIPDKLKASHYSYYLTLALALGLMIIALLIATFI